MKHESKYAGFWIRTAASTIDTLLILAIIAPILTAIYGTDYWLSESASQGVWDLLISYFFPAAAVIVFWVYKSATPGKMLLKLEVVDANTGGKPSTAKFIGRYLGYYLAAIPLMLGIFWVGFDKRKQGWHDKLAGTLVVKNSDAQGAVMTDTDPLAEQPFSFRANKSGLVHITYLGTHVTTLSGKVAQRFLSRVEGADDHAAQLAMAKATGNFKRGNEKRAKNRRS